MILAENLPLEVAINEKDEVKALGAKPQYEDGKFSHWFIPKGMDINPFVKWWPYELKKQFMREGIVENILPEEKKDDGTSLSSVLSMVKQVIHNGFKSPIWIRAEIINISGSHHLYFELSDYDKKGEESAKARAMIWGSDKQIIRQFKESTGLDLKPGLKILFKGKVDFSEKYGLGIQILSIDPSFTLGDMEAKVAAIKKNLTERGIFGNNKAMPTPFDFFKVVVIAPENAAGLGDFKTQADILEKIGLCRFRYIPAIFSGNESTKSIVTAIKRAENLYKNSAYDALVIIRGGGDKAGLYALNEQEIVEAVCMFPSPVIVGIGHERDNTLLDEVACLRMPTPSMVISHISSLIIKNADSSKKNMLRMTKASADVILSARQQTESMKHSFNKSITITISSAKNSCILMHEKVDSLSKQYLIITKQKLKQMAEKAYLNNPMTILNKGFTLIRKSDGSVAGSHDQISENEEITIQFKDGQIKAISTNQQ